MKFKGWVGDGDKPDIPKPWETFKVCLFGETIGEMFDDPKIIKRILKASGYSLKLEKLK